MEEETSACSFLGSLDLVGLTILMGRQIHCFVTKLGFDCGSLHVQSALIDM